MLDISHRKFGAVDSNIVSSMDNLDLETTRDFLGIDLLGLKHCVNAHK